VQIARVAVKAAGMPRAAIEAGVVVPLEDIPFWLRYL